MTTINEYLLKIDKPSTKKNVKITSIIKRKHEKGLLFDPETTIPFYSYSILLFRILSATLLERGSVYSNSLPENILNKLFALEHQINEGPNKSKPPECINPFLSLFGIGVETNPPSMVEWQEWKNLGNLSIKAASGRYVRELYNFNPNLMDLSIKVGALNRSISLKTALKVFAVYIIQRVCRRYASKKYHRTLSKLEKTAVILQKFFRTIRFRKKLAEIRLFAQSSNINMLTDSLVNGISVISYSEIKPNEVKASEVFLRLFLVSHHNMSRCVLYVSDQETHQAGSDIEKGIMISDVAEVRHGSANFPKAKSPVTNPDLCFSIIGTEKTLYVQLIDPSSANVDKNVKPKFTSKNAKSTTTDKNIKPTVMNKNIKWILRTMNCFIESNLSQADVSLRGRYKGFRIFRPISDLMRTSIKDEAQHLSGLLVKGLVVCEVQSGLETNKTMYLSWKKRRIYLGRKPILDVELKENKGFQVEDIAEIRRGPLKPQRNEIKNTLLNPDMIMTIISSETSVSLQLDTVALRNKMCRLFIAFMMVYKEKDSKSSFNASYGKFFK